MILSPRAARVGWSSFLNRCSQRLAVELHVDKAALKKITAEKKTAGKKAKSASAKKNALAMKKAGKGILDADFFGIVFVFRF